MGDFVTNEYKTLMTELFKEDMKMQTKAFTEHVDRVGEQYSQIKKLKENIQENEVIVQIFIFVFPFSSSTFFHTLYGTFSGKLDRRVSMSSICKIRFSGFSLKGRHENANKSLY
jgi:hypothetical protein